jgi:hypothetical protein
MTTMLRAAATAAALALLAPAAARAQQQPSHPRLGLGVSMNSNLITGAATFGPSVFAPPTNLYVPFYIAPNVRVEPQFGWLSVSDDVEDTDDSSFALGLGVLVLKPVVQTTNLYGGVRLVSTWLKDETRVGATVLRKETQRNTTLAAVFGGEYLPAPWFSVGVEGQLEYTAIGDVKRQQTGVANQTFQGGSARATQGLFFLRVYFM